MTEICIADELAGAAELVMGKDRGIPAAVVRGVDPRWLRDARWQPRSCGHPPTTCSAERQLPVGSARPLSLYELEHGGRPVAQGRPGRPAELDTGAARVEAAPEQLTGPQRLMLDPVLRRRPAGPSRVESWLTDVSRPVPMLQTQTAALGGRPHEGVDHVVDVDEVPGLLAVAEDGAPAGRAAAARRRSPPPRPRRAGPGGVRRRWPSASAENSRACSSR